MRDPRRYLILWIGGPFLALTLLLLYVRLFGHYAGNADVFSFYLAGQDMARGNVQLAGWWLPEDNFWLGEGLVYAIAIRLIGDHPILTVVLPAALWASVVMLACALARRGPFPRRPLWTLLPVIILLALPPLRENPTLSIITMAPIHVMTIAYALALFLIGDRPGPGMLRLVALVLLAAVAGVSDPFFLLIGVLPILLACLVRWERASVVLAVIAGAVLGVLLLRLNEALGGFQTTPGANTGLRFTTFGELGSNLAVIVQGVPALFGADFLDRKLRYAVIPLVHLPLLLLAVATVVSIAGACWRRFVPPPTERLDTPELLDVALGLGIIVDLAAGVFSHVIIDSGSTRYFLPCLIYGAILLARRGPAGLPVRVYYGVALAVAFAVTATGVVTGPGIQLTPPRYVAIGAWLGERGLTWGYGPYWSAAPITVLARGQVVVRPITEDGTLIPRRWITNATWMPSDLRSTPRPFFVLVDTHGEYGPEYGLPAVEAKFGRPDAVEDAGEYRVAIYR